MSPEFMCFRRQIAGAVCWLRKNRMEVNSDRKAECQALRRPKAPYGAGCSRTEMIYLVLSALLGLSAHRLRHAISACQQLCNRCRKRATAADSLPGDRMCPQASREDRYSPPVRSVSN